LSKKKKQFRPEKYRNVLNREESGAVSRIEIFSSHVRACQYKKQSFINKTSVKLISQVHSFTPLARFTHRRSPP
jgi:hypothetical protein